ncbi:hypothetical protein [Fictibacillus barbaricus]|uniref:Uncharacterized protein n=1 Tax=Fictibacillus barbaricus TaxID=182136 RepID=A0ABU1U4G8_9BACL|nr:hypothetical protein [Fictibacillus barbaricus]MDR7074364.1 hypothetical protein [Fictibacillus barbaricus]
MSLLLAIVPIIVVVLLLSGILFAFKPKKKKPVMGVKKTKWIVGSYAVILIIATVLSFLLPIDRNTAGKSLSKSEVDKIQKVQDSIYGSISNGRFKEQEFKGALIKKKSWSFPFNEKALTFSLRNPDNFSPSILVEKTNAREIQGIYYVGKAIVDGIDVTDKISSPTIHLNHSSLIIGNPDAKEVKFAKFSTAFSFDQFSGKPTVFNHESYGIFGIDILYLKVPKNVQITGDYHPVN